MTFARVMIMSSNNDRDDDADIEKNAAPFLVHVRRRLSWCAINIDPLELMAQFTLHNRKRPSVTMIMMRWMRLKRWSAAKRMHSRARLRWEGHRWP
jgi:hypothetical protein